MKNKAKGNIFNRIKRRHIILIIAVLVGSVVVWQRAGSRDKTVTTGEVKRGNVYEEMVLSGKINADEYVSLSYPVSGKVAWVGVREGDKVKKGQALGKLDTVSLNAAYQQALANLRAAEATVENVHDQVKDNDNDETFAQKDTRTTAEVAKDKAYEAVKIAQDNLRNATIYSPFDGIVTSVSAPFAGINVVAGEKHFEVINPKTIYFEVIADQTEVVRLKEGQKAYIILDAYPQEEMTGTISFISFTPLPGEVGTSYKIKINFTSGIDLDLNKFRVGMGGDVKFILSSAENVLFLPSRFIKSDSNGKYVNLGKRNNKVYVETGLEGEDVVEIKSGLKEGDIVYN
jgi:RND family efflux transporter MFP subunit